MGILRKPEKCDGYFKNKDAVNNLIRYITRTRTYEDRLDELKSWNVLGACDYSTVETIIDQFLCVQKIYRGKKTVRKMYHLVYSPDDVELGMISSNYALADMIAYKQSQFFYNMGFQTVYAVHDDESKRLHYHFAINSVNYCTGLMFRYNCTTFSEWEFAMNNISYGILSLYYPVIPIRLALLTDRNGRNPMRLNDASDCFTNGLSHGYSFESVLL